MPEDKAGSDTKRSAKDHLALCPIGAMLGAGGALRAKATDLFPAEFVEHAVGAQREFLLAIRSLVDEALKAQDTYLSDYHVRQKEKATRKQGPQKVNVE